MSCRSTPGMSVPMGLARIDSGLEDDQVQSLIHQLRHEYNGAHDQHPSQQNHGSEPVDLTERWQALRTHLEAAVAAHPRLRPQRRAGLIRRTRDADTPPDASMIYAGERIRTRAIQAARMLEDHLATEGARLGVPDREVQQLYSAGRAAAQSGRQEWPTDEERQRWRGLPLDPRTRRGLTTVAERLDNPDGRQELITDHRSLVGHAAEISVAGYHPESQRLEICTTDGMWLNYCNVDADTAAQIHQGERPDDVLREQLQGRRAHQYRDAVQAAASGVQRRCSDCGQYTGANHTCRLPAAAGQDPGHAAYRRATTGNLQTLDVPGQDGAPGASLTIDALADVAELMDNTDCGEHIAIPVADQEPSRQLIGEFTATLGEDDQIVITHSRAACTDPAHQEAAADSCSHVERAGAVLGEQLAAALHHHRDQVAAGTAAALAAEATAAASAHTQPASAALRPEAPDQSTFRYSDDPARFAADVRAAMSDPQVPFMAGDPARPVMYGFGADREFGVELEYDSPRPNIAADQIGHALYGADFTRTPRMQRYGAARSAGYVRDLRGGWTFEHDGSVDGEVVTPIMSDPTGDLEPTARGVHADHRERRRRLWADWIAHLHQRGRPRRHGCTDDPVHALHAPPPSRPAPDGHCRTRPRTWLRQPHPRTTDRGVQQDLRTPELHSPVHLRQRRPHRRPINRFGRSFLTHRVPTLGWLAGSGADPGAGEALGRSAGLQLAEPVADLRRSSTAGRPAEPRSRRLRRRHPARPTPDRRTVPPRRGQTAAHPTVGRRPGQPERPPRPHLSSLHIPVLPYHPITCNSRYPLTTTRRALLRTRRPA